jgi:3-methyladenine DNA glycosylase AlkD
LSTWAEDQHRALLKAARSASDASYREGAPRILKTPRRVIGTRVPKLRAIARRWAKDNAEAPSIERRKLVLSLWTGPSREEQLLALWIMGTLGKSLEWRDFALLRGGLDSWEPTDNMAHLLATFIATDPGRRSGHIPDLVSSEHLWTIRLGVVTLSQLNRRGLVAELTPDIIDRVRHHRDPMITKAVSWALREYASTWPRKARGYLRRRGDELPPLAVRETRNKLETGKKSPKK